MRWLSALGAALLILGIVGLIYPVIPFHHTEQVAKIGSFTANQDEKTNVVVSPYAGGVVVAAGVLLLFVGRRKV